MRLLTLHTVLAATDLTETSDPALGTAGRLAAAAGATLHVTHVATPSAEIIARPGRRSEYIRDVYTAMRRAGLATGEQQVHVVTGDPPAAISSLADRIGANVIVMGRHREGTQLLPGRPVGSAAYALITHSVIPCLVIRQPLALPLQRTLVAIDRSESAPGAMLVALSWTSALRSRLSGAGEPTLTALHVNTAAGALGDDPRTSEAMDHELDALRRSAGGWAGVTVQGVTLAGEDAVKTIAHYAMDCHAELVVLGTRGLSGESNSELGSISAAVTRQLDVPVLLVPPAVWRDYAQDLGNIGT
jgi:nucleotide-binding universal stress UspA family protein